MNGFGLDDLVGLAEVGSPASTTSAGASFLLRVAAQYQHAAAAGTVHMSDLAGIARQAAPPTDAEVWRSWVDLSLWQQDEDEPRPEGVTMTQQAVLDLHVVALRLLSALLAQTRVGASTSRQRGQQPAAARSAEGSADGRRLSPEEDARLRALTWLKRLGELSPSMAETERELRERDQRAQVREPQDNVVMVPLTLEPDEPVGAQSAVPPAGHQTYGLHQQDRLWRARCGCGWTRESLEHLRNASVQYDLHVKYAQP